MQRNFTPTYYQIKQSIKKKIADGILKPGDVLPGRVALSEEYEVSWSTLNRAVNELILEGVLTAQKGKGTFVSSQATKLNMGKESVNVWFCNPFPTVYATLSEMMDGLGAEAYSRDQGIQFIDNGCMDDSGMFPENIDGYIIITPSDDQREFLVRAWEAGQRFVVLNADFPDVPFVCINSDIYSGSIQVLEYLLDQGHRDIGLLGLRHGFSNYRHRQEAYKRCFEARGLPFSEENFLGRPEILADARDLFGDWIDRHPECTAIYAADYTSALVILEELAKRDLSVPEQVSVFSSGEIPFSSLLKVSLSTITQPLYDLGRLAMSVLLEQRWNTGTELLPCRISFRDSVRSLK